MEIVPVADPIAKGNDGHPDANDQDDEKWNKEIPAPQGSRAEDQHHNQQSSQRKIHMVMVILITPHLLDLLLSPRNGNAVKHFVAKLVKSFGRLGNAAESLDDFRYTKAFFWQRKILHSEAEIVLAYLIDC